MAKYQTGGPGVALLDGNVLNYLADNPAALLVVEQALKRGRLRLLATHILRDELSPIRDPEKLATLEAVLERIAGELIPTTGFVLDVSRLGAAALVSTSEADDYRRFTAGNLEHAEDALLALTARTYGAVLVTFDKRLLTQAAQLGVDCIRPDEFVAQLRARLMRPN